MERKPHAPPPTRPQFDNMPSEASMSLGDLSPGSSDFSSSDNESDRNSIENDSRPSNSSAFYVSTFGFSGGDSDEFLLSEDDDDQDLQEHDTSESSNSNTPITVPVSMLTGKSLDISERSGESYLPDITESMTEDDDDDWSEHDVIKETPKICLHPIVEAEEIIDLDEQARKERARKNWRVALISIGFLGAAGAFALASSGPPIDEEDAVLAAMIFRGETIVAAGGGGGSAGTGTGAGTAAAGTIGATQGGTGGGASSGAVAAQQAQIQTVLQQMAVQAAQNAASSCAGGTTAATAAAASALGMTAMSAVGVAVAITVVIASILTSKIANEAGVDVEYCPDVTRYILPVGVVEIDFLSPETSFTRNEGLILQEVFNNAYNEVLGNCTGEFDRLALSTEVFCNEFDLFYGTERCCMASNDRVFGRTTKCRFSTLIHCNECNPTDPLFSTERVPMKEKSRRLQASQIEKVLTLLCSRFIKCSAIVSALEIDSSGRPATSFVVDSSIDETDYGEYYVAVESSSFPSESPTMLPTQISTGYPTFMPTISPSNTRPSLSPSFVPSLNPTDEPSSSPSPELSLTPTIPPSSKPSIVPSVTPTNKPSNVLTRQPSLVPTMSPTSKPSAMPSTRPTNEPSHSPTNEPAAFPSFSPSSSPSTSYPTLLPTLRPSSRPSEEITRLPMSLPSHSPSGTPSGVPTFVPTASPTQIPTAPPSSVPSLLPTSNPSLEPSNRPTRKPTLAPSAFPSKSPTHSPSALPTKFPASYPATCTGSERVSCGTAANGFLACINGVSVCACDAPGQCDYVSPVIDGLFSKCGLCGAGFTCPISLFGCSTGSGSGVNAASVVVCHNGQNSCGTGHSGHASDFCGCCSGKPLQYRPGCTRGNCWVCPE